VTWVNHKSTTFFLGFLLGFPLWGTVVATVCSVLPDAVEFALRLRHRGRLHNPITYCFVLPLLLVLSPSGLAFWTAVFALFGIGLHLLEDWTSVAGIPVGRGRAALGLYRVGSPAEYLPTALRPCSWPSCSCRGSASSNGCQAGPGRRYGWCCTRSDSTQVAELFSLRWTGGAGPRAVAGP